MNLVGLAKETADRYRETLAQLTFNNKIVINTLTDIAKEDASHAEIVTRVIEERLKKVKPDQMLPIMYLIDSICKNIGTPYVDLFQQNLVSNFSYVFQHVNEKVRASLHKLRMTWGERYHVFTDHKLHQLDTKVHTIDPAWPVIPVKNRPAAPPANIKTNKIHVNPAFVGKVASVEDETERMRAELLKKEKELIELKQRELDLEIARMKTRQGMDQGEDNKVESRDPRSRDPRRKTTDSKSKDSKKSYSDGSRDSDSKSKKDRSPSSKSKSDSKSKSSSSSSKSSSSKSKSGSKSSSKSRDESKSSDPRKRPLSPGSPREIDGRISPLAQPDHTLGRIPKVKRSNGPKSDLDDKKRGSKRSGAGKISPVPDKKAKPLYVE